jgi:hypothetical protein
MKTVSENFKKLGEWKYIELCANIFLVIFSSIIILLAHHLRNNNLLLSGIEPYYYLENGVPGWIINSLSNFDRFLVAKIIPFVFGLVFIILLYRFLQELGFNRKISFISCLILILSPGFIYLFSTYNGFFLPVFILLVSFYFILKNSPYLIIFPYLIALFGILHSIIFLFLFLVYSIKIKKFRNFFYVLPSLLLSFFFDSGSLALKYGFIAEFGSRVGLSVFVILLFIFGFISLWREKYKYILLYVVSFFLFLVSYYDIRVLSYLNILLCLIAAIGLDYVLKTKWESILIRNTTIIVLIAGLFLSSMSFINLLANDLPNEEIIEGLGYMEDLQEGVVLSLNSRSYWLSSLSDKETIEIRELFYIRDLENSTVLLDKYGIDYIWVDHDMKEQIWEADDEGMLFLLKYSQKFKKIFNNSYIGIWKVQS